MQPIKTSVFLVQIYMYRCLHTNLNPGEFINSKKQSWQPLHFIMPRFFKKMSYCFVWGWGGGSLLVGLFVVTNIDRQADKFNSTEANLACFFRMD